MLGLVDPLGGQQRLGGDQLRFDRLGRRRSRRAGDLIGDGKRVVRTAAAGRKPGGNHPQRPFVPPARVAAVSAERIGGAPQVLRRMLVVAAHQRHLRKRVVNRAGGLVELHRGPDVERAMQNRVGALEMAEANANLTERGERSRQARALADALVHRDGPLGEGQRLIVPVANQRHIRLVPVDHGEHVVGLNGGGEALGLAEGRGRFVVAAGLRQHRRRQRVDLGEVAPIAGSVQCGGCFRDMLADDREIADLAVALSEAEVGESDRARIVRGLRLFQGAAVKRDRAGLLAARERDAAMRAPEI